MCGIAGYISLEKGIPPPFEVLTGMMSSLRHRGPDASGLFIDDMVGLGNVRLSIIDLDGGNQPIQNEDGSLWIVYNGEIFNYPELREGLEARGHRFSTSTDTEVFLHLYEDEGSNSLSRLNGQFAVAIWDKKKSELFLARDRLGIRPLHYVIKKGLILFASEVKALFQARDVERRIDPVAMDQIFTFWSTLPGRTVFKNVMELPPGHFMLASPERISVQKYWDVPFLPPGDHLDWESEKLKTYVRELLVDAVRVRLRADVPVGCYLSGGLDSSVIASIVKGSFDNHVRTFGVRFEERQFDESRFQEAMVTTLGTDNTTINATNADIGKHFRDFIWHCEKPVLRTAPVPLFLLSNAVRENQLKVVLTGEGADEVFGGYDIFKETLIREFWARQPGSRLRPLLLGRLYPDIFKDQRLRKSLPSFFSSGLDKVDDPLFSHRIRWENTSRIKTFFSEEYFTAIRGYDGLEDLANRLPEGFGKWEPLSRAQYLEMIIFMSGYLLSSQGDRAAMAHSVEIRLPFLDYRVVEFMGRIPSKWKIRGLKEKYLLKMIFKDMLPLEIINRQKFPYRAPIRQSLLSGTNGYLAELLSRKSIHDAGLFDASKVEKLHHKLLRIPQVSEVDGMALAGIMSTQLVHELFVNRFSPDVDRWWKPDTIIDRRNIRT